MRIPSRFEAVFFEELGKKEGLISKTYLIGCTELNLLVLLL